MALAYERSSDKCPKCNQKLCVEVLHGKTKNIKPKICCRSQCTFTEEEVRKHNIKPDKKSEEKS